VVQSRGDQMFRHSRIYDDVIAARMQLRVDDSSIGLRLLSWCSDTCLPCSNAAGPPSNAMRHAIVV